MEEYVQTMEKLSTDMRFIVHNLFYKRILIVWISLAFIILLAVIFVRPPVSYRGPPVGWVCSGYLKYSMSKGVPGVRVGVSTPVRTITMKSSLAYLSQ